METEENHLSYSPRQLVRDIYRFIRPYRWRFWLGSFLRFSSDISYLYTAYALASIVTFFSKYSAGQSLAPFWHIMIIWIGVVLYWNIAHHWAKFLCYQIAEKISLDAQLATTKHLFALDLAWHEQENAGNKLKRILNGGRGLENSVRMWVTNLIEISVNFIGTIIIISRFDRFIGGLMVGFLVIYFILGFFLLRRAKAAAAQVNDVEEDLHGLSFEGLNNIRSVKSMRLAPALMPLLKRTAADLFQKIRKRIFRFQSQGLVLNFWAQGFRLSMFIYIGYGIIQGHYEIGFLILFNGYFVRIWESVSELSDVTQNFIVAKLGVGRMMAILNEPIRIDDEAGKAGFLADWKQISLRGVSFSYGETQALDNISFDIRRGEKIGIVGLSGAGKSTLFKLLLKENESYSGEILFDGVPLRNIKKSSYLERAAVVLQETEVFNFTLRDNITIANQNQTGNQQLLELASTVAHVSDFLHKLPHGLDTCIGEKGIRLSGGEKQRVGIARAIFKQPQLLLLDEATSHLDLESEEKIRDSLHQFFQSVTALVIAHRLTTIKEMDRILVIEDGSIIESGSFDELHNKRGRFFELWEKQKL